MGGSGGGGGGFMGTGIGGQVGEWANEISPISWATGHGTIGRAIGAGGGSGGMWGQQGQQSITPVGTTSADQQAMLGKYNEQIQSFGGSSRPGLMGMMNNSRMNIRESTQVNPWATQQFFRDAVYNPAMRQLNEVTLPGIRESMGRNYWSTARRAQEQGARQATDNQLMSELAKMQYADEQARRQIADVTQARNIQEAAREQAQRINLYQLTDPLLQQHFAPMATAHTVDQIVNPGQYTPGLMDRLGQAAKVAGGIGSAAAMFA